MKRIKCDLSLSGARSIDNAIKEVELYTRDLVAKINLFLRRVGQVGVAVVDANSHYDYDHKDINISTRFVVERLDEGILRGKLIAEGEYLFFIEFGAGVRYNSQPSSHPKGAELGMTIGGYGKGHGNEMQWFYKDENDKWVRNKGIKAQMPVYQADLQIISQIERIAKEVFTV